jgi:single-stranded-DNA-specific exonuclease
MREGEKMRKEWKLRKFDDTTVSRLMEYLGVDEFLARLLVKRDICDINEAMSFINPERSILHDPYLLEDMDKAVNTLLKAPENESIVVFGDYDVDGVTSTALLYLAMKKMGFNVHYYIPLRLEEGYGLSKEAIKELYDKGHRILITVDCGVTSVEEIKYAKNLGFKVVVSDHHEIKDSLPPAEAVINPKRPDDEYPFKGLAGVGVAYKLMCALNEAMKLPLNPEDFLDIVALGTIADIVPLKDENRYIVKEGTKKIQKNPLPGLKALLGFLRINPETITAKDIAFKIAPKLNAAGRMDSAIVALELLISEDINETLSIARRLLKHNQNRQMIEAKIFEHVKKEIETDEELKEAKVLVMYGENWHLGVLGIVASRLVSMYNKPVFLISTSEDIGKGSARSPSGVSIIALLNEISDLFEEFGGHEMAAGFSIKKENIPVMRKRINQAYRKLYGEDLPLHTVEIDEEITLDEIETKTLKVLDVLRPFGHSNPEPRFLIKDLNIQKAKIFGNNGNHLKLILRSGEQKIFAIGFGMSKLLEEYRYVKPSLLKADVVVNIKRDNMYGDIETVKLSLVDANIYIDPVFEEEVRDKNFVFEFIRDWKNQQPFGNEPRVDVSLTVSELERKLSHKAYGFMRIGSSNPWGAFGNIRLKHLHLAWKILSNYRNEKKTAVVSGLNSVLAHTYHSLQHYIDPVKPLYANSLYRGEPCSSVVFSTLSFFMDNYDYYMEKFDEIIFDEPVYIFSEIYRDHPDYNKLIDKLPKILQRAGFTGSIFSDEVEKLMEKYCINYIYNPVPIKHVGIIDNRGTRKKVDQILSLVRHGENVAIIVDSPNKTVALTKTLGERLSHTLQNGELIFYNYLLKYFQRMNIYSLIERQKIKVLIATPSSDGLGVMLGNSNIVFYNAPKNFLEMLDAVSTKPGDDAELFLNLAFNKNDLLSNVNKIDKLFPTCEEVQGLYQDIVDVLPASDKDIRKALSLSNIESKVNLAILEEMKHIEYDGEVWKKLNGKTFSSEEMKRTLRYREGIPEKRMSRWYASKLSTTTTRSLLRSLMKGSELLKN